MAQFAAAATASQSSDGFTATFQDLSNYGNNDQGYSFTDFTSRVFTIYDYAGNLLQTLIMTGSQVSVTMPLTTDIWADAVLTLAGPSDGPFVTEIKIGFSRIDQNMYRQIMQQGCCQNIAVDEALCFADRAFRDASFASAIGDGAGFQNDVDAINQVLTPFQ